MVISIPYEATGRTNQKARTRAALLAATRELLAEGTTPTVEQAADRASISRTTAYRYFPNQRALLIAVYPEITTASLLDADAPTDPSQRLEMVVERLTHQVVEHEPELRAQLRLSLDTCRTDSDKLPFRKGRAIGWIKDALTPLREQMTAREVHRLALAIRATTGIEALVWLTDVAGLRAQDAQELMRSSARALLRDALRNHPPAGANISPRSTSSSARSRNAHQPRQR